MGNEYTHDCVLLGAYLISFRLCWTSPTASSPYFRCRWMYPYLLVSLDVYQLSRNLGSRQKHYQQHVSIFVKFLLSALTNLTSMNVLFFQWNH
ncbi:unnamed protein product [Acanthoscelides obtectus]|uniref:Uncharacterized protein n=1 Tax=Acanthoscelides obtectus TaxID=200917 RepID=A0A9P0NXH0_ACAOB|nr:unnamed protein product [Acanthoscelides obtectus]CAK1642485.1 hypothetical protein AOBTE_LOCUS13059 [Acanthoscelides obtectus]